MRRKHLSRHTNQECGQNRGRYPCTLCSKSYSRKEHLFRHNLFKHSELQIQKGKPGRPRGSKNNSVTFGDIDFRPQTENHIHYNNVQC